jgi:hypothetical protein
MDPSTSSATAGSGSVTKHRGRPPGSRNKAKVPARWTLGAGGPLCIEALMQGEANRALTLWGPAPGGALNAPSPVAAALAPRALGSIDRVLREVEAALGPSWGGELVSSPLLRCSLRRRGMPRRAFVPPPQGAINEVFPVNCLVLSLLAVHRCPDHPHAREAWQVVHACGRPPCTSELMTGSAPATAMDDS